MATRNPIVLVSGGLRELPAGDLIRGVGVFPFFKASGTASNIALLTTGELPFFNAAGAASNIPMV